MKTFSAKPGEIDRKWWVIDLNGQVVGRAASEIASLLRGKHKPEFTPHVDTGDFVVAVNAEKVVFTGNKLAQKQYYRHSGYVGGIKSISAAKMMKETPEKIIQKAVQRMLPKNILGQGLMHKFKVYVGPEHPHSAQNPETYEFKG